MWVCVRVCVLQYLLTFNINLCQPSIHSYFGVLNLIKRVLHLDLIGSMTFLSLLMVYWLPTGADPTSSTIQTKMMHVKYDIFAPALKGNKYSFELLIWPGAGQMPFVLLIENGHSVLEIPLDKTRVGETIIPPTWKSRITATTMESSEN